MEGKLTVRTKGQESGERTSILPEQKRSHHWSCKRLSPTDPAFSLSVSLTGKQWKTEAHTHYQSERNCLGHPVTQDALERKKSTLFIVPCFSLIALHSLPGGVGRAGSCPRATPQNWLYSPEAGLASFPSWQSKLGAEGGRRPGPLIKMTHCVCPQPLGWVQVDTFREYFRCHILTFYLQVYRDQREKPGLFW